MKIRVYFLKLKGKRHKVSTSEAACQRNNTRKLQIRAKNKKYLVGRRNYHPISMKKSTFFKDFRFLKKMKKSGKSNFRFVLESVWLKVKACNLEYRIIHAAREWKKRFWKIDFFPTPLFLTLKIMILMILDDISDFAAFSWKWL